jgi:hypothetical protein
MSEFTVNKNYHRFVKFKADNVYPPGIHLADILSVNLLKRNMYPYTVLQFQMEMEVYYWLPLQIQERL